MAIAYAEGDGHLKVLVLSQVVIAVRIDRTCAVLVESEAHHRIA